MAKSSALSEAVRRHVDVLRTGKVLCVDPSSGSTGSMPGYTLVKGCRMMESGYFNLPLGVVEQRLWSLANVLRTDADMQDVDLLVVEKIPPFMSGRAGGFRTQGVVNLHMGVGVVLGAFGNKPTIWVPPVSWKATCKREGWPLKITEGEARDEYDSLLMLFTVMGMAELDVVGLRSRILEVAG